MAQPTKYRIPPTSQLKLGAKQALQIQVNFCKNPQCDNFGITAKEEPIKPGPNPDRDFHYKVTNTAKGRVPAILCKSCKEKIPIKSNTGISAEFERITLCQEIEQHGEIHPADHPHALQTPDRPDRVYAARTSEVIDEHDRPAPTLPFDDLPYPVDDLLIAEIRARQRVASGDLADDELGRVKQLLGIGRAQVA